MIRNDEYTEKFSREINQVTLRSSVAVSFHEVSLNYLEAALGDIKTMPSRCLDFEAATPHDS